MDFSETRRSPEAEAGANYSNSPSYKYLDSQAQGWMLYATDPSLLTRPWSFRVARAVPAGRNPAEEARATEDPTTPLR